MTEQYFRDQQTFESTRYRHQQNRGRLATSVSKFSSVGQGSFEFEDVADFDVPFIEEPWFSYGAQLDMDDWEAEMGSETPPLPLTSGFVTLFERDASGLYVGAFVAVRVHFPDGDLVPQQATPRVDHVFRFEAVALKSLSGNGDSG